MKKYLWLFLMLVSYQLGLSADACSILPATSWRDTIVAVKITGTVNASLACINVNQYHSYLKADTGYPACLVKLEKQDAEIQTRRKLDGALDTALGYTKESFRESSRANDTLVKVIGVTSKIDSNMTTVRKLTEENLKRCEDSKPTLMQEAIALTGAFMLGAIVMSLGVIAVK